MNNKNLALILGGTICVLGSCSGIASLLGLGSTYHVATGSGRAINSELESSRPDVEDYFEDAYGFLKDTSREFVHGGVDGDTVEYYWEKRNNARHGPDRQVDPRNHWREVELEARQAIDEDDVHKLGYMGFGAAAAAGVAGLLAATGVIRRRND